MPLLYWLYILTTYVGVYIFWCTATLVPISLQILVRATRDPSQLLVQPTRDVSLELTRTKGANLGPEPVSYRTPTFSCSDQTHDSQQVLLPPPKYCLWRTALLSSADPCKHNSLLLPLLILHGCDSRSSDAVYNQLVSNQQSATRWFRLSDMDQVLCGWLGWGQFGEMNGVQTLWAQHTVQTTTQYSPSRANHHAATSVRPRLCKTGQHLSYKRQKVCSLQTRCRNKCFLNRAIVSMADDNVCLECVLVTLATLGYSRARGSP